MKTKELSTCFCTDKIEMCADFYRRHFDAKTIFDCGWYLDLSIGTDGPKIQFMEPRDGTIKLFGCQGIMLNFKVDDVDAEYERLSKADLEITSPLADHPWGDRSFEVIDPIGNILYIYSVREPTDEFKEYFK